MRITLCNWFLYPCIALGSLIFVQCKTTPVDENFDELKNSPDWQLQFNDPCTGNWQDNWFLDGKLASVTNDQDGMHFEAGPVAKNDAHHAVLWTKNPFEGDVKIEYYYTKTDSQTIFVNILYIQATGIGESPYEKDISRWSELREVPSMRTYFTKMNTLHISYAAYGTDNYGLDDDYVRARQYPVTKTIKFKDMAIPPDVFNTGLFRTGETYKITVIKTRTKLYFHVEGDAKSLEHSWTLDRPISIETGRIGLRHMYTRSAKYKDFQIWIK